VNFLSAEPSRKILLEECFIRDVTSKFFRSFGVLVSDIIIQKSKIGYLVSFSFSPSTKGNSRRSLPFTEIEKD
jgi:hypothetical protein